MFWRASLLTASGGRGCRSLRMRHALAATPSSLGPTRSRERADNRGLLGPPAVRSRRSERVSQAGACLILSPPRILSPRRPQRWSASSSRCGPMPMRAIVSPRRRADVAVRTQGRAPPAANLHVTLAFIGEVAPERIDALCAIGASVAASAAPFVLTLDCAGTFRGTGIAWGGASSLPPPLVDLARNLAARPRRAGLPGRAARVHSARDARATLQDAVAREPRRADRMDGHAARARCVGVGAGRTALPGARGVAACSAVRRPMTGPVLPG